MTKTIVYGLFRWVRKRQDILITLFVWGLVVGVVVALASALWALVGPPVGQIVPLGDLPNNHLQPGTPPGPYPSDPPAGGPHYDSVLPARFYEASDVASLPKYPEGYLVHNLKHGYVIFWYNCNLLDSTGCKALKREIRGVMDEENGDKVIAFPWPSIDVPLVMTAWGRMQPFSTFDPSRAHQFIVRNRYLAPEPSGE